MLLENTLLAVGEDLTESTGSKAMIAALDLNGTLVAWDPIDLPGIHRARSICPTPDGGCFVAGDSRPTDETPWSSAWYKFDSSGALEDHNTLPPLNEKNVARAVCRFPQESSGGYMIAGAIENQFGLTRLSADLDTVWVRNWPLIEGFDGIAYDVKISNDGNILACGQLYHDNFEWTSRHHLMMKVTPDGDSLWTHRNYDARLFAMNEYPDGRIVATGEYQEAYLPVHIISADGLELNYFQFASPTQNAKGRDITLLDGGDMLISGSWQTGPGQLDAFLLRLDATGQERWFQTFDLCGMDVPHACIPDPQGGYIMAGGCSPANDAFVLRTESDETAVHPPSQPFPAQKNPLRMVRSQPHGVGTVELQLPQSSHCTLKLYTLKGQFAGEVYSGWLAGGNHHLQIALEQQASGFYVLQAQIGTELFARGFHITK
jgi:hypothetical protein